MKLWNKYKVTSVPSLVFVDAATGKVVCRNGLLVVKDDPKGEYQASFFTHSLQGFKGKFTWEHGELFEESSEVCGLRDKLQK